MQDFRSVFQNIQVIELATALAGPLTGTFFQEMGAQVLKIEPPQGDVSRNWRNPFEQDKESSIYYDAVNGNKKSITLNLKNRQDLKSLHQYLLQCDILITNFTRENAQKFGLTFADLQDHNPRIILGNITGYGPGKQKPAFDMMIQADAGLLSMTGHPEGPPAKVPVAIADILASHQLREGLLCALLKKMVSGQGSEIQVALIDSLVAALTNQAGNYLMGKYIPQPMGTLHPSIAPYGDLFRTADGKWLLLAIGSERQFQSFCQAVNRAAWITDFRYTTNNERLRNRQELDQAIQDVIRQKSAKDWLKTLADYEVPAALIRTLDEVLDDPELHHLIIEEVRDDRSIRRVKTAVF